MVGIFKVKDSPSELNASSEDNIRDLGCKWFVYYYESGSYEGSGFAVWKIKDKFFYDDLGHCSCYGPTDRLKSFAFSFDEVKDNIG